MTAVSSSQALLETATGLLLDVQDAPRDAALRHRVEAWIAQSADHARAWQDARRTWAMLGEMEPLPEQQPTARIIAFPKVRFGRVLGGLSGLAAAAAALVLALSPGLMLKLRADQATGTGEVRDVRLADGSRVRLGARSAIDIDMTGRNRRVRLLAGEAWFDVVRDSSRPFVVDADHVETRVLGTAFEVRRHAAITQIGVGRGHVRVGFGQGQSDLLPGDTVAVDRATGRMVRGHVAVESIGGWREGYLFANNATIADVIEDVRRHDRGWIVLADAALGQKRVTGLYDVRDPGRALDALIATSGGRVERFTPWLTVVRGK